MVEKRGNLWTYPPRNAWRVIPLDGTTWDQACKRWPELAGLLNPVSPRLRKLVQTQCYQFTGNGSPALDVMRVITVPVPRQPGTDSPSIVPFERIMEDLSTFIHPGEVYVMPRVGCGEGGYDWSSQVRPILLTFPDNVIVVSRG